MWTQHITSVFTVACHERDFKNGKRDVSMSIENQQRNPFLLQMSISIRQ